MLRFLGAQDFGTYPALTQAMFRDRAVQFRTRLQWDVTVDAAGEERDQYDAHAPLYVIWQTPDGSHGGSMRLMPTTGRTMINDHFAHLLPAGPEQDAKVWECTRFCLAPGASPRIAAALILGGGTVLRALNLSAFLGVFDARMLRIYRSIGAAPEVLGTAQDAGNRICAGRWHMPDEDYRRVARKARLSPEIAAHWLRRAALDQPAKRAA